MKRMLLFIVLFLFSMFTMSLDYYIEEKPPQPKYTEGGMQLRAIVGYYSNIKEYRMSFYRGKKITYCNIFARDILDNREHDKYKTWFGMFSDTYSYDLSSIFPTTTSILSTRIDTAYWRALYAKKKGYVHELTPAQAQKRANEGIPVWIVSNRYTHEAIVCPDTVPFHSERGVLLAQAGEHNGVFYARDFRAFGNRYADPEIKYYEFPERKK